MVRSSTRNVAGFGEIVQHRAPGVMAVPPHVSDGAAAAILRRRKCLIMRPRQQVRVYADMAGDYGAAYRDGGARPDLGAVTLAGVLLAAGRDIRVVDGDADPAAEIPAPDPDELVLLRCTLPTWREDLEVASRLRSDGAEVILWGAIISHLPNEIAVATPHISGHAATAVAQLLGIEEHAIGIGEAYQHFPLEKYVDEFGRIRVHLQASRGCNRTCSYCPYIRVFGRWSPRTTAEFAEDVAALHRQGVGAIQLRDQDFAADPDHAVGVAEVFRREGNAIQWSTEGNLDRFTDYILDRLAEANCEEVIVGLESASPEVLRASRRKVYSEAAERLGAIQSRGIKARGLFVLGLPEDSWSSIRATLDWAVELGLDYAQFNPYAPLPSESFGTDHPSTLDDFVPGTNFYKYRTCEELSGRQVRWAAAACQSAFNLWKAGRTSEAERIRGRILSHAGTED